MIAPVPVHCFSITLYLDYLSLTSLALKQEFVWDLRKGKQNLRLTIIIEWEIPKIIYIKNMYMYRKCKKVANNVSRYFEILWASHNTTVNLKQEEKLVYFSPAD